MMKDEIILFEMISLEKPLSLSALQEEVVLGEVILHCIKM
jgi:hypothetical protein